MRPGALTSSNNGAYFKKACKFCKAKPHEYCIASDGDTISYSLVHYARTDNRGRYGIFGA